MEKEEPQVQPLITQEKHFQSSFPVKSHSPQPQGFPSNLKSHEMNNNISSNCYISPNSTTSNSPRALTRTHSSSFSFQNVGPLAADIGGSFSKVGKNFKIINFHF